MNLTLPASHLQPATHVLYAHSASMNKRTWGQRTTQTLHILHTLKQINIRIFHSLHILIRQKTHHKVQDKKNPGSSSFHTAVLYECLVYDKLHMLATYILIWNFVKDFKKSAGSMVSSNVHLLLAYYKVFLSHARSFFMLILYRSTKALMNRSCLHRS